MRKDALHKLTTYLAKNHSQIVIEDLNVSGMMSNHK
ncbi:transposase [Okeania sp. SIO3B5]